MSEDSMDERGERVKEYFRLFSMEGEKWAFAQENEGIDSVKIGRLDSVKIGKRAIATGYLGLQGTWHEREAMGKSKGSVFGWQVMEGNFRRNGTEPINSNVQGFTG